jgi:hypothetical protein
LAPCPDLASIPQLVGLRAKVLDRGEVRDRDLHVHGALEIAGDADQPLLHRGELVHERVASGGQACDRPVGLLARGPQGGFGVRARVLGLRLRIGPHPIRLGTRVARHQLGVAVRLGLDRLGDLVGFADHARDPLPELLVGIPARLRGRAERALGLGLRVAEQHAHELDLIGELLEVPPHLVRVVPAPDRYELPSADLLRGDQDREVEVRRGHGEASSNARWVPEATPVSTRCKHLGRTAMWGAFGVPRCPASAPTRGAAPR